MIARIWHGWALRENADEYEALLREEIFHGIQERQILGLTGIALWRRETDGMTEFVTKMEFESLSAVREFAGDDYELAVVPEKARKLLLKYDERSQHYEIVV
jgi:hypothetical protein